MIAVRSDAGFRLPATSELTYALAVSLLATIFGLAMPVVAYLSGSIQATFSAEYPRVPAFLIEISPWGPLLFAALGIAALVAKQSWCRPAVALRANLVTIASAAIVGGVACFLLLLPAIQLLRAIPG